MKRLALALVVFTAGCSGNLGSFNTSNTPLFSIAAAQRKVFSAKEGYGIAERLAIGYANLVRCAPKPVLPCSDPVILAQITRARDVARDALAAAQTAVDTPDFGTDVISTSLTAMNASVGAFNTIASKYGRKQ